MRRLENETLAGILKTAESGATLEGLITDIHSYNLIKVSINQFYGIEINDFAVTVAKTALWIAESQMMKETENIVNISPDFLSLKMNAYIIEKRTMADHAKGTAPCSSGKRQSCYECLQMTESDCVAQFMKMYQNLTADTKKTAGIRR